MPEVPRVPEIVQPRSRVVASRASHGGVDDKVSAEQKQREENPYMTNIPISVKMRYFRVTAKDIVIDQGIQNIYIVEGFREGRPRTQQ